MIDELVARDCIAPRREVLLWIVTLAPRANSHQRPMHDGLGIAGTPRRSLPTGSVMADSASARPAQGLLTGPPVDGERTAHEFAPLRISRPQGVPVLRISGRAAVGYS